MKHSIEVFLATCFIILALLYISQRYTTFEMHPVIFGIPALLLVLGAGGLLFYRKSARNLFTGSIFILTLLMLLSFMA